jgi:hypothetical protein
VDEEPDEKREPVEQEEELPELDTIDPLKRDPEEGPGGLDPVLPAPPPE